MATATFQPVDIRDSIEKRQECVLLVEDNEDAMYLVQCALEEYGNGAYKLEWVNGLTGCLERLSKGGVDIVLLDLGLPESSGPLSYIRVREAAPEIPVLVLTGDTRAETESAVDAFGAEDFLVKDEVSGALLLQAIRAALYTNKRWKQQKSAAYKTSRKFVWANEACEALLNLGVRLVKSNKALAVIACGKQMRAISDDYAKEEGASGHGRADLLLILEQLAGEAASAGQGELATRLRAILSAPAQSSPL
jgi:CheY-like chemotaxis protein